MFERDCSFRQGRLSVLDGVHPPNLSTLPQPRLLEVLGMYKPFVKEYSRLNITHNVMSKRKLNRLVTERYVRGWDDPRLMTLSGLRRRGVPPSAMNAFCR